MNEHTPALRTIMIVAGEASGDLHGAGLVKAMKKKDPGLYFFGVGGVALKKEGVEVICESDKLSVMGLTEIFTSLLAILKSLKLLKSTLATRKPDLLILIDFAEFNIRLAKEAKKQNIPVFYYIPPKVWVWRKKRTKLLAKYVKRAAVILPFEEKYLRERGVEAKYVGTPVLDSVKTSLSRKQFCAKYNIDSDKALVGILPGSRKKEVSFLLPVFLESARRMQQKYSRDLVFLIPLASTLTVSDLEERGLKEFHKDLEVHVFSEDKYDLMAACDAVVAASGTVTLELAILDTPMIVAYKFAPLSYLIGKLFIDIPFFSLVNIIAGKRVVPELLQDQANAGAIELELARILFDEHVRGAMKKDLQDVRNSLGEKGASENAAQLAFTILPVPGNDERT